MKTLVDKYFELQKEIHTSFGYEEDWRVFPLQDCRDMFWEIEYDGCVYFSETQGDLINRNEAKLYCDEICQYVHLKKYIYRTEEYTMILVDTMCDANVFLRIFDNKKEVGGKG